MPDLLEDEGRPVLGPKVMVEYRVKKLKQGEIQDIMSSFAYEKNMTRTKMTWTRIYGDRDEDRDDYNYLDYYERIQHVPLDDFITNLNEKRTVELKLIDKLESAFDVPLWKDMYEELNEELYEENEERRRRKRMRFNQLE